MRFINYVIRGASLGMIAAMLGAGSGCATRRLPTPGQRIAADMVKTDYLTENNPGTNRLEDIFSYSKDKITVLPTQLGPSASGNDIYTLANTVLDYNRVGTILETISLLYSRINFLQLKIAPGHDRVHDKDNIDKQRALFKQWISENRAGLESLGKYLMDYDKVGYSISFNQLASLEHAIEVTQNGAARENGNGFMAAYKGRLKQMEPWLLLMGFSYYAEGQFAEGKKCLDYADKVEGLLTGISFTDVGRLVLESPQIAGNMEKARQKIATNSRDRTDYYIHRIMAGKDMRDGVAYAIMQKRERCEIDTKELLGAQMALLSEITDLYACEINDHKTRAFLLNVLGFTPIGAAWGLGKDMHYGNLTDRLGDVKHVKDKKGSEYHLNTYDDVISACVDQMLGAANNIHLYEQRDYSRAIGRLLIISATAALPFVPYNPTPNPVPALPTIIGGPVGGP